jgi:hypothetical protein
MSTCPAGTYSSAGEAACRYCPAGQTSARGASSCTPCDAGDYCPGPPANSLYYYGTTSPDAEGDGGQLKCPPNHYCPPGTVTPIQCSIGQYCPSGSTNNTARCPYQLSAGEPCCPIGTYNNKEGSSLSCKLCPAGKYGYDSSMEADPLGNGCNKSGYKGSATITSATGTPIRYENLRLYNSDPECESLSNPYSNGNLYSNVNKICMPYYSTYETPEVWLSTVCAPLNYPSPFMCRNCPPGTYNVKEGVTNISGCLTCPAGTFSNTITNSCNYCPPGTWSTAGSTNCVASLITPGNYYSGLPSTSVYRGGRNLARINQCPAGTFSIAGARGCTYCPPGQTSTPGSSSCSPCSQGEYCPGAPAAAGSDL